MPPFLPRMPNRNFAVGKRALKPARVLTLKGKRKALLGFCSARLPKVFIYDRFSQLLMVMHPARLGKHKISVFFQVQASRPVDAARFSVLSRCSADHCLHRDSCGNREDPQSHPRNPTVVSLWDPCSDMPVSITATVAPVPAGS